jgi:hypothetical protein
MITGWGRNLTTWTPHSTAHAVHPERVDTFVAMCGAPLVIIDQTSPWSGEDTGSATACGRCTELVD